MQKEALVSLFLRRLQVASQQEVIRYFFFPALILSHFLSKALLAALHIMTGQIPCKVIVT